MIMIYDIFMRTIVDIPQNYIDIITTVCKQENISRAEAVRRAILIYINAKKSSSASDKAFGIWKSKKINALKYEEKLREEWKL
jgi:metal-responsive CopG/Arc/MetJ family transcriptional regulator